MLTLPGREGASLEKNKTVKFTVMGEPKGKGRPRFATKTGHAITPKDTVAYENLVRMEYVNQCGEERFPDDAMLDVRIMAFYGIPRSTSKKRRELMLERKIRPVKKPDFDNIGKIVCDSLNTVAYHDDAAIVDAQIRKFYSEKPRIEVTIRMVNE